MSLSWHHIGLVDVLANNHKVKSKRNWIDNFNVSIHHHSPSFVTVSFGVEPTSTFKKIVHDALLNNVPDRVVFKLPQSFRRLKLGLKLPARSILPSELVKQELIENLMIEFKCEATAIISQYLKGIFIRNGSPIPSIELFCENPLGSQVPEAIQAASEIATRLFWDSIGMSKDDVGYYKNEENGLGIFLPNHYRKDAIDKAFKLLFEKLKVNRASDADDIDDEIIRKTEGYLEVLTPILIIQGILQHVLKENMSINKTLLNKATFKRSFINKNTFRKLLSLKQKINILQLPYNRILLEFKEDWIRAEAKYAELPRMINDLKINKKNRESDFLTNIIEQIKYELKVAQENFNFINAAVNEFVQAETVDSNYKVQKTMLVLTIVIVLLTVITALPEETRKMMFSLISAIYHETIQYWAK